MHLNIVFMPFNKIAVTLVKEKYLTHNNFMLFLIESFSGSRDVKNS